MFDFQDMSTITFAQQVPLENITSVFYESISVRLGHMGLGEIIIKLREHIEN